MGITSSGITPTTNTGATNSTTSDNDLGPNAFLQLLTTELQNQDPDNPQDATESVTQLAQMSELQYQETLTNDFASFQSNFSVLQAASLIGKAATVNTGTSSSSSSSTVTGIIQSIDVQNGTPYFTMTNSSGQTITDSSGNPLLFSTSQIVGIGTASSLTNSSTSSATRF
ncbi:MAG TPA: flagellar hook capping FlgD N-terminal domain-containing protein [Candidatus Acidoferrales bacterium]|nr:flagellar hook capping FlgD N-terminal domain-containing protein [Candidatus Acidoferrales bacterium]HTX57791.1 flagellar hook capping FlgD N-terminal domain-containing protein [Candidatus Acidoferrales bacterium]